LLRAKTNGKMMRRPWLSRHSSEPQRIHESSTNIHTARRSYRFLLEPGTVAITSVFPVHACTRVERTNRKVKCLIGWLHVGSEVERRALAAGFRGTTVGTARARYAGNGSQDCDREVLNVKHRHDHNIAWLTCDQLSTFINTTKARISHMSRMKRMTIELCRDEDVAGTRQRRQDTR